MSIDSGRLPPHDFACNVGGHVFPNAGGSVRCLLVMHRQTRVNVFRLTHVDVQVRNPWSGPVNQVNSRHIWSVALDVPFGKSELHGFLLGYQCLSHADLAASPAALPCSLLRPAFLSRLLEAG